MEIHQLQEECYKNSKEHGFWEGPNGDNLPTKLCLIHSEVSEALEAFRDGDMELRWEEDKRGVQKPEGFVVELADVLIRVFDLAGRHGMNLEVALIAKMKYNETRPYKHGGKYA